MSDAHKNVDAPPHGSRSPEAVNASDTAQPSTPNATDPPSARAASHGEGRGDPELGHASTAGSAGDDAAHQDPETGVSPLMLAAARGDIAACRSLIERGAPWNALDAAGRCAGDYALREEHQEVVDFLLDTGCRTELLFGAMDKRIKEAVATSGAAPTSAAYLAQRLQYTPDGSKLMDADGEAVMMGWEGPLMKAHAAAICGTPGDVLNIGFGLGLIDDAIQAAGPRSHTIIEAHPDVYARMQALGWDARPGVRLLFGRWQDVLPGTGPYDGIFFDTYAEYYGDMRELHAQLPTLLRPGGIYSFFNGLAPEQPFFHAVYARIAQLELGALGMDTTFVPLPMDVSANEVWAGVKNRYWSFDTYFLPVAQMREADEGTDAGS